MIHVAHLTKRYGQLTAVDDFSFDVQPGEIVGLIGPNGAGKTTFFNLVTGLLRPDRGEILLDGASVVGLRPHAIVGRGIARTFQSIRLFQNMSVLDGSLGILPRRIMVDEDEIGRARTILADAGIGNEIKNG